LPAHGFSSLQTAGNSRCQVSLAIEKRIRLINNSASRTVPQATAKESASNTVRFFGDSADYLLVENPARFKSAEFSWTALGNWLRQRNTPTLRIPTVTAVTMNAWEALEDKLKRYVSLDEVCRQKELHELSRYELQFLRNRFLVQFEYCAGQLLPDTSLIKNRVSRCRETTQQKIDRFNDPLLATV
jgi:hypothetical protein